MKCVSSKTQTFDQYTGPEKRSECTIALRHTDEGVATAIKAIIVADDVGDLILLASAARASLDALIEDIEARVVRLGGDVGTFRTACDASIAMHKSNKEDGQ